MVSYRAGNPDKFPEYLWVARNITALREYMNMSQTTFAARVGMAQPHVSAIERMATNISLEMLSRIAAATGVSAGRLLSEEELTPRVLKKLVVDPPPEGD